MNNLTLSFLENSRKHRSEQFSEREYESIRNEMIQRINTINSQASTAIITILSTWAAALTLSLELIDKTDIPNNDLLLIIIIRTIIFLVPVFYFIPLAVKSGENVTQIVSISAYIRVFYDYLSFKNNTKKMNWETSNNVMSSVNVDRKNKESLILRLCDETYTILAMCSLIFYIIFSIFSIIKIQEILGNEEAYIASVIAIILCFITGIAVILIHNVSCTKKNMMNKTQKYIDGYIQRAYELGIYSEADVRVSKQFLNTEHYYKQNNTETSRYE